MKDVSYTVILYSYYSICNNIHVRCQLFFFDMPYIPDPCTMYSNLGTDSKSEMGFPRFNSSVHKAQISYLAGWEKKKNDIFSKEYSTRPLSYIQYTVKKG